MRSLPKISSAKHLRYTVYIKHTHTAGIRSYNWGEPERAPHIRKVCEFCLSVRTFITQQFTNIVLIYGVPLTVDCSFEDDVFYTAFASTNTL